MIIRITVRSSFAAMKQHGGSGKGERASCTRGRKKKEGREEGK